MNLLKRILEKDSLCFCIDDEWGVVTRWILNSGAGTVVIFQHDKKIADRLQVQFEDDKRVIIDHSEIGKDITLQEAIDGYGMPQLMIREKKEYGKTDC